MEGGDVGHWVLEFLLRARYPVVSSNLLKKVLRIVPLSDFDSRLQKTLLLRTLQDHLFAVSVPESVLETLELLEELHRRDDGALITAAAMSAAYCAIAVDCTLKHLLVELHNNPAYLGAVNRIWRGRVRHMSGSREGSLLLSLELERWRTDIETSLLDSLVRERLASIDTRRDAVVKLRDYLMEAWTDLGPSFLELAALAQINKNALAVNYLEDSQQPEREIEKCTAAPAEEVHTSTDAEVQKVGECGSVELQKLAEDSLLNSLEVNEEAPIESRDADVPCPLVINNNNNEADLMEKDQTSIPHNHDHKSSLMERNSTARIYEWDDSIDGLEDGTSDHATRFNLPSPKWREVSPLDKYKPASITKRRKVKKWSQLEEETLKTAVDKFGRGNWKLILDSHKDIFEERTEVDLKDKWRNMRLIILVHTTQYKPSTLKTAQA
ncbi:telomeric repeat-binding factor 2 isoform X1 [Glycine max]|uniref:Uncharacterized protein n=3 Tax=Glycine subgen. Soja TaxID=1462606 RepID=A0A0R0K8U1_SOYBN|nr:telomeric repeat-binding factor 2 isoform X1 [Glycine max]